mmetsp:Transcript_3964/g.6232  ORF Transcript_3964/g.6232 Transcript_3964/m.6232 type:complete len:283 (+) Transcript_3964:426-1274(+)
MGIHQFRHLDVGERVEPAEELLPLVLQVAPHREGLPLVGLRVRLHLAAELPVVPLARAVGHHRDLPRHREALERRVLGRVVAARPARVRVDRLPLGLAHRDLPGGVRGAAADDHARLHQRPAQQQPLQRLHAAQGAADHRLDAPHPQALNHRQVHAHGVPHGHRAEVAPVGLASVRVCAGVVCAPVAARDHVRADHEVLVGVERLPRPQKASPPAFKVCIPCQCVAHNHGIVFLLVQGAPGFVANLWRLQGLAAFKLKIGQHSYVSRGIHDPIFILHSRGIS